MLLRTTLLPLLILLSIYSCRTVKKSSTEESHVEERIKGIKYDSVSTSKDKTISISDVKEIKKGDFEIEIIIDSSVKWDSMWIPKSSLDILNKVVHTPNTKVKIRGNINAIKDSKTTIFNDKNDSVNVSKGDSSKVKIEDKKSVNNTTKKGMSFGFMMWGIVIIIAVISIFFINYWFPFLPKLREYIKKIFNKNG